MLKEITAIGFCAVAVLLLAIFFEVHDHNRERHFRHEIARTLQPPIPNALGGGEKQGTHGQQETKSNQGTARNATPPAVKVFLSPEGEKEAADITSDANEDATINKFLLLVTGALAFFAAIQLILLRRQINQSGAEFRTIQRAYVTVEPLGIDDIFNENRVAKFRIRNSGNLPARNMRWYSRAKICSDRTSRTFPINIDEMAKETWGDKTVDHRKMTAILASRGQMRRFFKVKFSIDPGSFLHADEPTVLYHWGVIYYSDGFCPKRWIRFCFRYEADGKIVHNPPRSAGGSINTQGIGADRARQHQFGNDTNDDESCPAEWKEIWPE